MGDEANRPTPSALVTGATSGIGFATACELARRGRRVVLHGRTQAAADAAAARVRAAVPGADVAPVGADLGSMAAVRALAERVLQEPLMDVVIHSAGLERWGRETTPDGFELTFAVNHLAPFLLTLLLAPTLERSRPARVVFVSSMVHGWGTIRWDDLMAASWYAPEPVYYQSKLASALASRELARRLAPRGISVLLCPPGLTRTRFARDLRGAAGWWSRVVGPHLFRAPKAVARELADVALSRRFEGVTGAYIDRLEVGLAAPRARVPADVLRMWSVTCALLGLTPDDASAGALPALTLPRPRLARWLALVTTGELVGFTATALVAFVGLTLGGRPVSVAGRVLALVVMVFAGTIEGASLGYFQWRALRRWLPDLSAPRFVGATVAVAAGGWLVGMSVPLVMTLTGAMAAQRAGVGAGPSALRVGLFAMGFGAAAGALFGVVQGRALAPHVRAVTPWVVGSALGWAAGLPFSYAAGAAGSAGMSAWRALALSAAAGLGMGACVAVGTFAATRWMEPRRA